MLKQNGILFTAHKILKKIKNKQIKIKKAFKYNK